MFILLRSKYFLVIVFLLTMVEDGLSQEGSQVDKRNLWKTGISFQSHVLFNGVAADYFLTPHINISGHTFPLFIVPAIFNSSASAVFWPSLGIGVRYYFQPINEQRKWFSYIGAEVTNPWDRDFRLFYFPIGFHLIRDSGSQLNLEIAALQFDEGPNSRDPFIPWVGLRFGKRLN